MALHIEEYALLSDASSCALVGSDGSIDWLTVPRFDSGACFAALLGDPDRNGRWLIAPAEPIERVERSYRGMSLVLETVFYTKSGSVAVVDCMPPQDDRHDLVRVVEGREGNVAMTMHMTIRFDYGSIVPWVRRTAGGIVAVGGPEALRLATPVETRGEEFATVANFTVRAGERVPFTLGWFPSNEPAPQPIDAITAVAASEEWWNIWSSNCSYDGDYQELVVRSLVVLKGLTHTNTGGLVAAATTSLPETLGGARNWDYRYCWLRDATFTLMALEQAGFHTEAVAWRDWLLRAVAGQPEELQIMYGTGGERRLTEIELDWLDGYEGSKPVRVGNAAHGQFQLDVYGEVMDALYQGHVDGEAVNPNTWSLVCALIAYVADCWKEPDDGIWEMRGERQHFTHSKVMAWVAVDRAIEAAENFGPDSQDPEATGPKASKAELDSWKQLRSDIKEDVLANGLNEDGAFVQHYGSNDFDASLLLVPLVGFLEPDDPRCVATVAAIEKNLTQDGLVLRYRTNGTDGLKGAEGAFLMCSFWLADNYALMGRLDDATELFERLAGMVNDVGLLSEEYDPVAGRMLGNFPQAFSHVSLVNTAGNIYEARQKLAKKPHPFIGVSNLRQSKRR